MKVFVCNCFPHELEFGGIAVAENELDAKKQLKELVVKAGWVTDLNSIQVVELDVSKPNAMLVDPVQAS